MTVYRVVRIQSELGMFAEDFNEENVYAALEVRGFPFTEFNDSKHQHDLIKNAPKFDGLLGPMYDGEDVIRYESPEVYRALSA
jgi:hypothetical protein